MPADIAPQVMEATEDFWLISKADIEAVAIYVNDLRNWITVAKGCIDGAK